MDTVSILSLVVTLLGATLGVYSKFIVESRARKALKKLETKFPARPSAELAEVETKPTEAPAPSKKSSSGSRVLFGFSILVAALGIFTLIRYWDTIMGNTDRLLLAAWLFLIMVAGMFVQVLASNHAAGKRLFDVDWTQLVYPVLFSIVVFYPVWAIGSSSQANLFSLHAAFLNGFFWENVVSAAKVPEAGNKKE